jgi:hypothetical protein
MGYFYYDISRYQLKKKEKKSENPTLRYIFYVGVSASHVMDKLHG